METENSDVSRYLAELERSASGLRRSAERSWSRRSVITSMPPSTGPGPIKAQMWTSPWLRLREKVLGTVFVPGGVSGLILSLGLGASTCATSGSGSIGGPVVVHDTCP